ncbi:16S rRNA (cytosine(1402)-N(4))-methyltransferase [hydrothermal vent metagenome]|uniref:16S rRNA (Cytosine(1402)-N(4))-methyltransferase n=1 Tax=hydrothermal vent metagenome TaxID=652676 RepID=A0A3B1DB34_9ZZZZ
MHIPAMQQEVIDYLKPKTGAVFIDGTLGMGGHARAILERIGLQGRLIGFDKDKQALEHARRNLSQFEAQCDFVYGDFRKIDEILEHLGVEAVDGILLDLGISSFQIDDPERGFSIRHDGPLDMRMDQNNPISAFDLVNGLSEKEIDLILKEYGEERWHHAIAGYLVRERTRKPIETTQELSQAVLKAVARRRGRERIHPATRTFQAFRIAVNRELESLEIILNKCLPLLKEGGRMGVISFHSLEDRIVKRTFRQWAKEHQVDLIVKKPLRPTEEEIEKNPRARSARLRVIERV